jgi:hypothetical protein
VTKGERKRAIVQRTSTQPRPRIISVSSIIGGTRQNGTRTIIKTYSLRPNLARSAPTRRADSEARHDAMPEE